MNQEEASRSEEPRKIKVGGPGAKDGLSTKDESVKKEKGSEFMLEDKRLMNVLYMIGGLALVYFVLIFWR